ncbi:putative V-type proton ATPase subunit G [Styela clava]|uniref:probable V-type proton ATPase subunit G n=1 Tax=Styela clava TaxID=7725 RepID=UPI001939D2AD|nr:probable V-type proton ATPase subunit G [Styela clava]
MASQTPGIQQLLLAEKAASEKVAEARKRKAKRLKQAKEEAKTEIEEYKKQTEQKYKQHEFEILGSKDDSRKHIERNQVIQMQELDNCVQQNKGRVIQRIMELVCDVKPSLNENYVKQ